jgi:Undecaprenyl-phosphate glucose phosphotransferase
MQRFPIGFVPVPVLLAMLYSCILLVGMSFQVLTVAPGTFFPAWLMTSTVLVLSGRIVSRVVYRSLSIRGSFNANVAVFGSGSIALRLRDHLEQKRSDIALVGVYDDRPVSRRGEGPMLEAQGTLEDLLNAGRDGVVDQIIIALPPSADQRIAEIARKLEQLPVSIHVCTHIASDLLDAHARMHRVSSLGPIGMIDVKRKPMADWGLPLKWLTDKVLGTVLFLAFLPIMVLIALLIKIDDGGSVLFRQQRRGLNNKSFQVLKFRTMREASDSAEVRQATRDDPRVTRLGWWLRRTSFDELPQLVNVLKGDMSLVGPRPHALVHDEYWGEHLETYANRHQVKPGITGWAQINGYRGETGTPEHMRRRVEHDLYYIDNWSIWLDLRIIAATPFYGFAHSNAY